MRILGLYYVLTMERYHENTLEIVNFILGLEDGDVCIYLSPLNSLLELRGEDEYHGIYFHHSSFMDFLRSPERSKDYCIDSQKCHFLIAQCILQQFTSDGMCPQSLFNLMSFLVSTE